MNYRTIVSIAILMLIVSMMAVSPVLAGKPDGSNGAFERCQGRHR